MQALVATLMPARDRVEIVELGDRARVGLAISDSDGVFPIDAHHVVRVAGQPPVVLEFAAQDAHAQTGQSGSIVDLVAVDTEHPAVLADVRLDVFVRVVSVVDLDHPNMIIAARYRGQDLGRPVVRLVVEDDDVVAEFRDVHDRPGNEVLFVAQEANADDAHGIPPFAHESLVVSAQEQAASRVCCEAH